MDLMDAPVEDGAMPSPSDMGVGLDQEKMAAFDAAVNKRRDDEAALVTKNQAEAKSALAQLETERQNPVPGPHAGQSREGTSENGADGGRQRVAEPAARPCRSSICRPTPSRRRGHVAHAPGLHPDEELGEGQRLVSLLVMRIRMHIASMA